MSVGFPEIGDLFVEKYRVQSVLGSGGFSRIYHAIQVDLERDVALKILRPPIDDSMNNSDRSRYLERVSFRFQQEARLVSRLRSPFTITMYDYGRTPSGLLYMVLEYVSGQSIAELLAGGAPVAPQRVVKILNQILISLHEAHALGMLHRDLKPANIMVYEHLGQADQVKLLDFGIAKVIGDSHQQRNIDLTSDGNIIGTPRYMSPEQIRGDHNLTPSSDLYSMGLVAYEMLTGKKAITGNSSLQIITRQISRESFLLPESLDVHPTLRMIVNRMLSKPIAHRYPSAQEIINDLQAIDFDRARPLRLPRPSTVLNLRALNQRNEDTGSAASLVPPRPALASEVFDELEDLDNLDNLDNLDELEPLDPLDPLADPDSQLELVDPPPLSSLRARLAGDTTFAGATSDASLEAIDRYPSRRPTRRHRTRLAALVGLFVALSLTLVIFALTRRPVPEASGQAPEHAREADRLVEPVVAAVAPTDPVALASGERSAPAAPLGEENVAEESAEPVLRDIEVSTQPAGARILLDDQEVGRSPLRLPIPERELPVVVTATYRGESQQRTITAETRELTFQFQQRRATSSPSSSRNRRGSTVSKSDEPSRSHSRSNPRRIEYLPVD